MTEERIESELDKIFGDGTPNKGGAEAQAMIRSQGKGDQAFKYLIETSDKSQLMDLLMRTVFVSREEMLIFNDYVSWCEDFNIPLDNARRYAAARPAVGGLAREQLVESITSWNIRDTRKHGAAGQDEKESKKLPT